MQELFKSVASSIAVIVEGSAVVLIAIGALEALWGIANSLLGFGPKIGRRKAIWLRFGVWLLLGLEFELAADIIRTAIAPTWTDIGQLSAIGLIRTFLNFFLEKDLEKYREPLEFPA
jgi:uncharacterized membrane protein